LVIGHWSFSSLSARWREAAAHRVLRNRAWQDELQEIVRPAGLAADARHLETAKGLAVNDGSGDLAVDVEVSDAELAADALEQRNGFVAALQPLQRFGTQASLLSLDDLYGLGATYHLDYDDRIAAITVDDVKRVAKRVIRLDAPVIAVIR